MDALLSHFVLYLPLTPPVISLCRRMFSLFSSSTLSYTFIICPSLSLSLSLSLSHPFISPLPHPLLAGRLGGDKFGGGQAEGGQTRSLCVHIVEQETGRGGGGVARR